VSKFELKGRVSEYDQTLANIETTFKEEVALLQANYDKLSSDKAAAMGQLMSSSNMAIVKSLLSKQEQAPEDSTPQDQYQHEEGRNEEL
jgi:hypothetical protein